MFRAGVRRESLDLRLPNTSEPQPQPEAAARGRSRSRRPQPEAAAGARGRSRWLPGRFHWKPRGAVTARFAWRTCHRPAQPMASPGMQLMSIQCPPGATAGQQIVVDVNGQQMQVAIPAGVVQGQTFQIQVPSVHKQSVFAGD